MPPFRCGDRRYDSQGTSIWCRPLLGLVVANLPLVVARDGWRRLSSLGRHQALRTALALCYLPRLWARPSSRDGAGGTGYLWQHLPDDDCHIQTLGGRTWSRGRSLTVDGRRDEESYSLLCIFLSPTRMRTKQPGECTLPEYPAPGSFHRLRFVHSVAFSP